MPTPDKITTPFGAVILLNSAGERNRTPAYWLEASRFTIKLRPHSTVYAGHSSTFSIQAPINLEKSTPNLLSPAERTVTWAVP